MMKRVFIAFVLSVLTLGPVAAQTKKETRNARKEAAAAARTLRREGYKPLELGNVETKLEAYFLKLYAGCTQVVGTADNCMSTNLAQVTALSNAANEYAMLSGGEIRGRITSSTSSLTGQQLDNLVSSFERLVRKDIRGELVPYVTAVRDKKGRVSARTYCIVDVDAASRLRRQALELALEEQSLAETYGTMVSEWIGEGFRRSAE